MQQIFRILKPDLRHGREQITIKHHLQIDILPFPALRKDLFLQQDWIDESGCFQDVFTGLIRWVVRVRWEKWIERRIRGIYRLARRECSGLGGQRVASEEVLEFIG